MASPSLEPGQSQALRALIKDLCGVALDDNGSNVLSFRIYPLIQEFGCSDYWELIRQARSGSRKIIDAIIDAITTNETSWFRDQKMYEELRQTIIPSILKGKSDSALNFWSAACSTGQEPYTLSMLISEMERNRELDSLVADRSRILATDISPAALALAQRGEYDSVSMNRGLPLEYSSRYFKHAGGISSVTEMVKRRVEFKRINLIEDPFGQARFDLVLIRNVLIYFTDETKAHILKKVHRALLPGGILIVGASENAQRYTEDFRTAYCGGAMYYEKNAA